MRPLNSMGLGLQAQPRPPTQGGGSVPAPYPPPAGYQWEYVTERTATDPNVYENGERVVELTRIAA